MADKNPSRALSVVTRIEMMCDFVEHPAIKTAVEQAVPVSMPRLPGALGFDIPLWVGLGTVGLWAALDGFSERADLDRNQCPTCGGRCIAERFASYVQGKDRQSLEELEDRQNIDRTTSSCPREVSPAHGGTGLFFLRSRVRPPGFPRSNIVITEAAVKPAGR